MLKYIGRCPHKHVVGGVLFTCDASGAITDAQDARTFEPATPEQVAGAEAIAAQHTKFWQVVEEPKQDKPECKPLVDLDDLKKAELQDLADARGIDVEGMTKAEIIDAIQAANAEKAEG